ncbi:MAG TPA: POTRA domain-containing protein [Candidatus Dormibacteraeota bacterium]|nr:POTRA domain-containing protein [Candidatus Dormibacteraeota bacterium]
MKSGWVRGRWGMAVLGLLYGAALGVPQLLRAQAVGRQAATKVGREAAARAGSPVVTAVRIVTEDGKVLSESPSGISIEVDKPLDPDKLAESLTALYRTGDYADLRAVTTPVSGGVRLDFVVRENFFFNQVQIEGLVPPPSEASATAAMQLTLGQVYRRETLDEARERLRETLREEGWYTAEVSAETVAHPETHQMDVIVHIKPGRRARVGTVQLNNTTEFSDVELLERLKLKVGGQVTSKGLQQASDRIRKFLVKKGHLIARAVVRRGSYDPATNTIPLRVEVTEGPRVQIGVAGARISKGDIKKLVPMYQEGALDTDLLEEGKRNIRERLERDGYFDATVEYKTETREVKQSKGAKAATEVITYQVTRGKRHRLLNIDITGNHYFSADLLRSRLQIFGGAFGSRGRFSRRLVESDAQSMRNLYAANGFLEVNVRVQVQDDYQGKEGDLRIVFEVQEGPQTRVASLSIEGVHAFKEEVLLGVIGSTPGQPYSEFNVASDRDNILAMYFNEGYPEASFTSTAEAVTAQPAAAGDVKNGGETKVSKGTDKEQPKEKTEEKKGKIEIPQAPPVRLIYRIQEGPQTRVRQVLLAGEVHTRPSVIRREVRVKANEPLREGEVVDSQRRLYNLGVFNRVTIEPQNPTGTDPNKNIVVLVEEAKRYTVSYGGGFEVQRLASTTNPVAGQVQAAPRGILEVSKLNLTGRADSLSLKLRGSTLEDRALLVYSVPNTLGHENLSFQASAYTEKTQDISTFTEMRYEGSLQLTDRVTPVTTVLSRYVFRQIKVSNLKIAEQEVPLFQQPTLVSQFGATWIHDKRNNPADATKGSFDSADVGIAGTAIGSSANFLRLFYQNSTYHPIQRRFSFARSIRFGLLYPFGSTVSLSFPLPSAPPFPTVIPLPERFFAGGGTSLRGFALNQAGPRDSFGFPIGGQAMLLLNQEFRFPMRVPFVGTQLGGAIFYDGGNVYTRLNRISFRPTLPKPTFDLSDPANPKCVTNCSNELNYFSHTIGFGVRYSTPVGPIRIDLGYQINRPFFVIPCTPITAINAKPTCFKATQLPGFQIFFNLGSSF